MTASPAQTAQEIKGKFSSSSSTAFQRLLNELDDYGFRNAADPNFWPNFEDANKELIFISIENYLRTNKHSDVGLEEIINDVINITAAGAQECLSDKNKPEHLSSNFVQAIIERFINEYNLENDIGLARQHALSEYAEAGRQPLTGPTSLIEFELAREAAASLCRNS